MNREPRPCFGCGTPTDNNEVAFEGGPQWLAAAVLVLDDSDDEDWALSFVLSEVNDQGQTWPARLNFVVCTTCAARGHFWPSAPDRVFLYREDDNADRGDAWLKPAPAPYAGPSLHVIDEAHRAKRLWN